MVESVRDVLERINASAPFAKAAEWYPVGLQIGDPERSVQRVAVAHEVSAAVLDRVEADRVDLLVVYRPLLFAKVDRLVSGPGAAGRAYRVARSGVALAVVHTAFDVVPGGTADALAVSLGLVRVEGFGPLWGTPTVKVVVFVPEAAADRVADAMAVAGAGRIGGYSACSFRSAGIGAFLAPPGASPATGEPGAFNQEPEVRLEMIAPASSVALVVAALVEAHPYEEPAYDVIDVRSNAGFVGRIGQVETTVPLRAFAQLVEERLAGTVRVAGDLTRDVGTVAVVPGSGSSFIDQAAGRADVIVTGDVSHHRAVGALERGIAVVDPGHTPTERPGLGALYAVVAHGDFDTVDLTAIDPNPWKEW